LTMASWSPGCSSRIRAFSTSPGKHRPTWLLSGLSTYTNHYKGQIYYGNLKPQIGPDRGPRQCGRTRVG
jgi:hypothetical protein